MSTRFQPVILVIDGKRLECPCGALATFVNVKLSEAGNMEEVCVSCHDCYCKDLEALHKFFAWFPDIKVEQLDSGEIVVHSNRLLTQEQRVEFVKLYGKVARQEVSE